MTTDICPDYLEAWESAAIIAAADMEHWQLVFTILWETGIRLGECLALKASDILPGQLRIQIEKRRKPVEGLVGISPFLEQRLRDYAARSKGSRLFPYTRAAAWLAVKRATKKAGILHNVYCHMFRHGFGHRLANMPSLGKTPLEHLRIVQEMMHHAQMRSTEVYIRPGKKDVDEAWRRVSGR